MGHIFLSFIFYNILFLSVYLRYKQGKYYIKKKDLFFYTILLVTYGTYGGGEGDFLHYEESVKMIHSLSDAEGHLNGMEIQYNYLAFLVDGNYYLWRLIICIIEFGGMSWLLYKAKLNTYPILLCFITLFLILSVYQRSYWGVIYFFLGLYLLLQKRKPLYLVLMSLCCVSHTQNLLLIALLPLALINVKKWLLICILFSLYPLGSLLNNSFFDIIISGGIDGADYVNDKMAVYSQSGIGYFGSSIGEYLLSFLRYTPMFILFISWNLLILKKNKIYSSLYKPYQRILNITLGIFCTSIVVYFANLGGGTFFYRTLAMTYFPVTLLLPYMRRISLISKKTFNICIFIFALTSEYSYIKDLYYAYQAGL